jgi:hypothetical protein
MSRGANTRLSVHCSISRATEPFRTKSDTQTAFNCANPAKRPFSAVASNTLIRASFHRNRALSCNGETGFDSRTRCQCAMHCEGRCQELNGDLTWRGVNESARPPITASPHLVQARSRRFITSFATGDVAARASGKDAGWFQLKRLSPSRALLLAEPLIHTGASA